MTLREDCLVESDRWEEQGRLDIAQVLRLGCMLTGKFKTPVDGIQDYITYGVSENIIVYDSDATTGSLTSRLILLIKNVMKKNYKCNPTELYIPEETLLDTATWPFNPSYTYNIDGEICRAFGVDIIPLEGLNEDGDLLAVFKDDGASLAPADNFLCVGLNRESVDVVLGSF